MILFYILNFYLLFDSFYSRETVSKHTIWLLKLNFLAFSHVGEGVKDFLIPASASVPPLSLLLALAESKSVVIGTDQNIDLLRAGDHSGTPDFIINMNVSNGLAPTVTKWTRVTHNSATLIDNFYVTCDSLVNTVFKAIQCDLFDHFPILLLITGENCIKGQPLRFKARKVDDLDINEKKCETMIETILNPFLLISDLKQYKLKKTLEQYAPKKKITISYKHVIKKPLMTKCLFKSSRKRNQYYRQSLHKQPKHAARLRYIHYRNVYNS